MGILGQVSTDQIRYDGPRSEMLFVFDGEILEIFGLTQVFGANQLSVRFHRDLMTLTVEQPDRHGNHMVEIRAGGLGACKFEIVDGNQPVIDFLERVRAALPAD